MSQADEDREMQEKLGISDDEMRQMGANERQQDRNNNAFGKSWSDQGREARRVQQEMERGLRSFAEEQVRNRVVSQPQPPATTVQTSSTILTNPAPPPQPKKSSGRPERITEVIHKPFSFALERGANGAEIYFGSLIATVTRAIVNTYHPNSMLDFGGQDPFVTREALPRPTVFPALNLKVIDDWSFKPTKLNFWGDIYLKWEIDKRGTINPSSVNIVGPEVPSGVVMPDYNEAMTDPGSAIYTYYVKIGKVPQTGDIEQDIAGDFHWNIHLLSGTQYWM